MKLKYIFCGIAFLAIAAGCSKNTSGDAVPEKENGEAVKQQVTINASIPETLTKVDLNQDPSDPKGNVQLTWKTGDQITVYKNGDHSVKSVFTLATGNGEKNATFTGDALDGAVTSFDIEYSNLPGTFATQTQPADASTSNLKYAASLTGVNAYQDIEFSQDWADNHGSGTFGQSSVLRLRAKLPAGAAARVTSVIIKAFASDETTPQELVDGGNTLTVEGISADDKGESGIITVYATLPAQDIALPAGSALLFKFNTNNASHSVYTHYRVLDAAKTFIQGRVNAFNLDCSETDTHAGLTTCDGTTEAKAYLIGDKYQLDAMHETMVRGEKRYYKLIDDVNVSGIVWIPLNNGYNKDGTQLTGDAFNKYVDFNGNNKTISYLETKLSPGAAQNYAGFFGVLMGNIYDLTIDHATIHPKGRTGILAGWIGTANYGPDHCEVRNITITNSNAIDGGDEVGILGGRSNKSGNIISNITITDCSAGTSSYAGGLVANFVKGAVVSDVTITRTNVTSTGHANGSNPATDGFAGGVSARVSGAVDFDRCTYQGGTIIGPTLTAKDANSETSRFAGGLVGYVDDGVSTTFDDCHVISATLGLHSAPGNNNGRYVGGAFGYLGSEAVVGNTIGCSVENLTMNDNVRNYIGGFVSYLKEGTIKNSTASSTTEIGTTNSGAAGGFIGYCEGGTLYNNSSSVNVRGAGNPGGFVGWNEGSATSFELCSSSGNVSASGNNAGGFAGIVKVESTFTACSSTGHVESSAGYVGGLIGYINADGVTVTKCYSTSTISATGNFVGGLVGVSQTDLIEKSYYHGSVTGSSNVGGILGRGLKDNATSIENCYSRGTLTGGPTEQRCGGIVGDLGKGGTVTNCWSDMTLSAGRVIGGIVGLACYQTWGEATESDNTISGCIAWTPSVSAKQSGNYGSSGAIVGHTSFKNVLSNCYRLSTMSYKNSYDCSGDEWDTVQVDQPDCDGTNWVKGTTPGTKAGYTYQQPYYGKAASSTATVSTVARDVIGWSDTIWDFSEDLPKLK